MRRKIRSIRTAPPAQLRKEHVLVRMDAGYEREMRPCSATLEFLSSNAADFTVITEEPDRVIDCDIFCNDALSLSHESRLSTITIARNAKLAVAGLEFRRDLNQLEAVLAAPEPPIVAVLGGRLSRNKLVLAARIARLAGRLFIGGELCIPFVKARGAFWTSASMTDEMLVVAAQIIEQAHEDKQFIFTPSDFIVLNDSDYVRLVRGEKFILGFPVRRVSDSDIRPDEIICDVGPVTQWSWIDNLGPARTIFWHGPLGMTEFDAFSDGTRFLAVALATETDSLHHGIVCGRELTDYIRRANIPSGIVRYLSPAASAALYYFAGQPLPAVEVLRQSTQRRRTQQRVLIPLEGTENDANLINAAAHLIRPPVEVFLLHVRKGWDEERHPDFVAAMTQTERYDRHLESEHIFARANSLLAEHGLISAAQYAAQGKPRELISRYAARLAAAVVVERSRSNVLLVADHLAWETQHA